MDRGFLIIAENTDTVDYIKCATALAASIKHSMPNEKIALATMDLVTADCAKYFDKIVPLPYGDLSPDSNWKLINDWQAYKASPFDQTIKLEADMYIPRSISHWFDLMSINNVTICTTIRNFKQEVSDIRAYRRFIDENKLPDCYNAITYFDKSAFSELFFSIVADIFENWDQYRLPLICNTNEMPTTDFVYALASHILGVEKTTIPDTTVSMVHMKQFINGLPTEKWTDTFVYELLPNTFRINTTPQLYPVHYHVKTFADDILTSLQNGK